ncbi:MAG TPA: CoA transferase [Acetobacteraceae bacterium]|nr:CoA transferase [Acetobacteraceae bacterium]
MLEALLETVGVSPRLAERVTITGHDPVLDTPFRLAETAAAVLGAAGALFAEIWRLRGGRTQEVTIDVRAASLALESVLLQRQWGYPIALTEPDYPTVAIYPTRDGRFVMLNGGYPLLRDGLLELLRCADQANALARAVAEWDAAELENAIADRGLCGVMVRTEAEWRTHPQGSAIAELPAVELRRIGDAPPRPLASGPRPLSGIRVLDLTHVIAGPTCAKSLAEQGATVLHVYSPRRPQLPPFDMDTGHGKLTAFLDLAVPGDAAVLRGLAKNADVFSQSYRPQAIASLGFSPEALAALNPGIIVVSTSCYGQAGPWRYRPGFEQLAQCATGMATGQGAPDNPVLSPMAYPNDYITGFLAAVGTLAALIRRASEGGSWHVQVSLCRTAMMIQEQGRVDPALRPPPPVPADFRAQYMKECDSPIGRLSFLGPVIRMSETSPRWDLPPAPLGAHPPRWPDMPAS